MSFKQILLFFALIALILLDVVENKSVCGIGKRMAGDHLLLKDVLQARSAGLEESPQVKFTYDIAEPMTYLEIVSEENVYADVSFSYEDGVVEGTVKSQERDPIKLRSLRSFEVLINIYGFDEGVQIVDSRGVFNRNAKYDGIMEPTADNSPAEEPNEEDDDYVEMLDDTDEEYFTTNNEELQSKWDKGLYDEPEEYEEAEAADFDLKDKIVNLGKRQKGDMLLYHTYQSSLDSKDKKNHTVIFYYIDSHFITNIKFVFFDHFADKSPTDPGYIPPVLEYSFFSPHSLKAVIQDYNATFLFIEIFVYGYHPENVTKDYEPFISPTIKAGDIIPPDSRETQTYSHNSALQRIKHLLNDCDTKEEPSDDLFTPVRQGSRLFCNDKVDGAQIAKSVTDASSKCFPTLFILIGVTILKSLIFV